MRREIGLGLQLPGKFRVVHIDSDSHYDVANAVTSAFISVRMPQTFLPAISTSLGHFKSTLRFDLTAQLRRARNPAASEITRTSEGGSGGPQNHGAVDACGARRLPGVGAATAAGSLLFGEEHLPSADAIGSGPMAAYC